MYKILYFTSSHVLNNNFTLQSLKCQQMQIFRTVYVIDSFILDLDVQMFFIECK